VVYPRPPWRRRRRAAADTAASRPFGCLWPLFWLILIIVVLGLLFGGYRKGTKVGAPQSLSAPAHSSAPFHHVAAGRPV
jgi:Na+/proline symporter